MNRWKLEIITNFWIFVNMNFGLLDYLDFSFFRFSYLDFEKDFLLRVEYWNNWMII